MGLAWSSPAPEDGVVPEDVAQAREVSTNENEANDPINETEDERKQRIAEEINKFKEDLAYKRELRKKKLYEVSDEMNKLKQQLEQEITIRKNLEKELIQIKQRSNNETESKSVEAVTLPNDLIVTKYSDDDDEIEILDEHDDFSDNTIMINDHQNKRKKFKKKVSFSLELVKELDETSANDESKQANNQSGPSISEQVNFNNADKEVTNSKNPDGESNLLNADDENLNDDNTNEENSDEELDELEKLKKQNSKLENQIKALKDVANLSKQLLGLREAQVEELNNKLSKLAETEKEFEKKMSAMAELRRLYDEKGRAMIIEHNNQLQIERTKYTMVESKLKFSQDLNEDLDDKVKHLGEKVKNLDNQLDETKNELSETKIKLATEKESLYHASSQIKLINNLVTQIISGPELDLDHLARFLQENHALINELTAKGEIDYVASALVGVAGGIVEIPKEEKSDIAENLSKVWKVLVELLSHHKKTDSSSNQLWESCYKSVDTPKGPKLEISVSQTFIKLKDLILEKNSLVKEVTRLKKLNSSLEGRMEEQENRLTLVTEELHNTWDVVNKLKKQHNSLHTHEKILKHELQHKRSMLNGLKKQLEVCREQWQLAREKNSKTENDWLELRNEFRSRKIKRVESGFEDEVGLGTLDSDGVVITALDSDVVGITPLESEVTSPDYDTDVEEEISDNSNCDNNILDSLSPSETSESESNLPISEILDNIFDEAYNIVKNRQNQDSNDYDVNKYVTDLTMKRLEQIPEEEEEKCVKLSDIFDLNLQSSVINYETQNNGTEQNNDIFIISEKLVQQIITESNDKSNKSMSFDEPSGSNDVTEALSNESILTNDNTTVLENKSAFSDNVTEIQNNQTSVVNTLETQGNTSNNETKDVLNQKTNEKTESVNLTTDEILRRRDERLKRMEESCKTLFQKMGQTSNRGEEISNKLDQIHATYGPQSSNNTDQSNSQSNINVDPSNQQPSNDC